jgi:thioredoxin-related protein
MKLKRKVSGLIFAAMMMLCSVVSAQTEKKIYDPSLDGMKQINEAVTKAKSAGRHVLIQYGGNWCPWCIRFDAFCKEDAEISKLIEEQYNWVKLNYSPENKNEAANTYLGNPVRFGFPVLIVIDGKGKVIHIQDCALLQEDKGYNRDKTLRFLKRWTPAAIIPKSDKK